MLGTISVGLLIPVRTLFEDRLGVVASLAVIVGLLGAGAFFFVKARRQE